MSSIPVCEGQRRICSAPRTRGQRYTVSASAVRGRWDVTYDSGERITDIGSYLIEQDVLVEDELPKLPSAETADFARITAVADVRA